MKRAAEQSDVARKGFDKNRVGEEMGPFIYIPGLWRYLPSSCVRWSACLERTDRYEADRGVGVELL